MPNPTGPIRSFATNLAPPSFDSKDADLLEGMDLPAPPAEEEGPYRTGDPELDAYLAGDDDDDDFGGGEHLSIDDLDDLI